MTRSGQAARRPPRAAAAADGGGPVPCSRTPGVDHQAVWPLVGLAAAGHVLRSRRFYERVAVAAVVLGTLRRIGQENTASTMERMVAWNKRAMQREMHRVERKAKRQARAVKTTRQMVRSAPSKDLADKMRET